MANPIHLLLHFDVNGTLILKDTSKGMTDEDEAIIYALAESTEEMWTQDLKEPISFKEFVYNTLVQDDKSDPNLKTKRRKVVTSFLTWMEENKHPALERVRRTFETVKAKCQSVHQSVFSSFFVMVDELKKKDIHFTIILRTFGGDLQQVTHDIHDHKCGVAFTRWGQFQDQNLRLSEETLDKVDSVFDAFLQSHEHFAIKDDFQKHIDDEKRSRSGKPFIYDAQGNRDGVKNLSLFFDDNITYDAEFDIVRPIELTGTSAPVHHLLYKVNTIQAILDDNYFIDRVNQALAALM